MKTVWTLDIGNSHPHVGKFVGGKLIKVMPLKSAAVPTRNSEDLVLASVVGTQKIKQKLNRPAKKRRAKNFLGMPVHYAKTLGEDRLLCARYLFDLYPGGKIIFIDAGTFTTVDSIDTKGFAGGFILPGKKVLEDCFQKGQNLKKIKFDYQKELDWPNDTQKAMSLGIKKLQVEFIKSLLKQHPKHKVVLTGGNAQFFKSFIPKNKMLMIDPHLIHQALFHCGVILCSS